MAMVWIKRIVLVLILMLVLLAGALSYVMIFVDPNGFKDELQSVARQKADIRLRLDGDIKWSFFPWIGLEMDDIGVALGSGQEIVRFDHGEFGVAIEPLFKRSIQVKKVLLDGLKANLFVDKKGQANWLRPSQKVSDGKIANVPSAKMSSISHPSSNSVMPEAIMSSFFPDIHLDELLIKNAEIHYRNLSTNQKIRAFVNVALKNVQWDKAWPMDMSIHLKKSDLDDKNELELNTKLKANLAVFPQRENLSLDSLSATLDLTDKALFKSKVKAKLTIENVDFDVPQENVLADGISINSLGVRMDAQLKAYQVLTDPQFSAMLSSGEFNLREVFNQLDVPLPAMADDQSLTSMSADITLEGNQDSITIQPISVVLDNTKIEANAVVGLSPLHWDVNLAGSDLDLDRYLPPKKAAQKNNTLSLAEESVGKVKSMGGITMPDSGTITLTKGANAVSKSFMPLDLLRSLNGHIGLVFKNMRYRNLKIDQITLDSTQSNGLINVSPVVASLYQGKVTADVTLDTRTNVPTIEVLPNVEAVQIQPLLKDYMDLDKLSGKTYMKGEIRTRGNQVDSMMSALQGDLLIDIKQGALVGTNLTKTVCQGIAAVRKEKINQANFGENTPFESLSFPAHIVNGQVATPGLNIRSAGISVTGEGVISLPDQSLNYQADVALLGSELDKVCRVNDKVTKLAFPILCKGKFSDDPASLCRPDLKGFIRIFKTLAKQELDVKLAAEKEKLKAEQGAKLSKEQEELKEKLKNKLKSLF